MIVFFCLGSPSLASADMVDFFMNQVNILMHTTDVPVTSYHSDTIKELKEKHAQQDQIELFGTVESSTEQTARNEKVSSEPTVAEPSSERANSHGDEIEASDYSGKQGGRLPVQGEENSGKTANLAIMNEINDMQNLNSFEPGEKAFGKPADDKSDTNLMLETGNERQVQGNGDKKLKNRLSSKSGLSTEMGTASKVQMEGTCLNKEDKSGVGELSTTLFNMKV